MADEFPAGLVDSVAGSQIASYQIACFLGNSLPVVGVGVVSMLTTPVVATAALALVIALLALVALATEMRFGGVQVRR